jgi:sugar phosphate isomerase/epimerase
MKIGISRPSMGDTTIDILKAVEKYGFEGLQFKGNQYGPYLDDPGKFKAEFGDLARMVAGGLINYPDGNKLESWPETVKPVLNFAAAVGADHVCLCAGISREYTYSQVADMLVKLGQHGAQHGLKVSLHNHAGSLFEFEEDFDQLVPLLDTSVCGITLDTGHTAKAGIEDASGLVKKWKDALLNVHLKDMDTGGEFCLLGTGTVTLTPVLDALKEIGYDQWLIIDEETKGADLDTGFGTAMAFLKGSAGFIMTGAEKTG